MRILQIVADGNPGGGTTHVLSLAKDLQKRMEYDITLITDKGSYAEQYAREQGVPVGGTVFFGKKAAFVAPKALKECVRKFKPDIVHVHGLRAATFLMMAFPKGFPFRVVYTVHGYHFQKKSGWRKSVSIWLEQLCSSRASQTVFVCEHDRQMAEQNKIIKQIEDTRVIYNGVAPINQEIAKSDPPVVLFMGRLHPQKRPLFFLDIVQNLAPDLDCEIVMIGDGSLKPSIEKKLEKHHLERRIKCLGALPHTEALKWLAKSTLLVMPSAWEGFPIVLLEAAMLKTFSVVTETGGVPEIVKDRLSGALMPEEAPPEAWAGQIDSLLQKANELEEMSKEASSLVAEHYPWKRTFSAHLELYQDQSNESVQKKQRILINGRFLTQNITGVQRYGHEIVKAFDVWLQKDKALRDEIEFILVAPEVGLKHHLDLTHIQTQLVGGNVKGHMWEQLILPKYAKKDDILLCPGNTAPILSLLGGVKNCVTVHDLSFRYFPSAYSRSFRYAYHLLTPLIMRRADSIITVSQSERQAILDCYPTVGERLFAVQNGSLSDDSSLSPLEADETQREGVLYVGSLSQRKNVQGVIEAARYFEKEQIPFRIVGDVGGIFAHMDESDIPKNIDLMGRIESKSRLVELYQKSACFLFPSFYEASPLPPMEAMACGCPVVAGDIPSLRERCGDAALYCSPADSKNIADQVRNVISSPELARELAKKGKERVADFTWQTCARHTWNVLKEM